MKLTAIHSLYKKDCHFDGNDYFLDGKKLTKSQTKAVNAEIIRLEAEVVATQYKRDRVYLTIQEQLDMQYHDSVNGTTVWLDTITAIKTNVPKV